MKLVDKLSVSVPRANFGSAIASPGDLNHDGYNGNILYFNIYACSSVVLFNFGHYQCLGDSIFLRIYLIGCFVLCHSVPISSIAFY